MLSLRNKRYILDTQTVNSKRHKTYGQPTAAATIKESTHMPISKCLSSHALPGDPRRDPNTAGRKASPPSRRLATLLGLSLLFAFPAVRASHHGSGQELILFGSAEANRIDPDSSSATNDALATADILYSLTHHRLRVLAEYIVSTEEGELERLQIGWLPHETTWLFTGRYHQPTNFWGSIYHHGQYLQTSITRPSIDNWEDEHGIIQAHQTGLMVESNQALSNGAGLEIAASFGTGSDIGAGELEPFDILDPDDIYGHSFAARVGFLFDALGDDKIGLLYGHNKYESTHFQAAIPDLQHVNQQVFGAFLNWARGSIHVISAVYNTRHDLYRTTGIVADDFTSGYVQVDKTFGDWTAYGRWEKTAGASDSEFLSLFPEFIVERATVGLRLDFLKRHAVTVEFFDAKDGLENYRKIAVQWSAAFK